MQIIDRRRACVPLFSVLISVLLLQAAVTHAQVAASSHKAKTAKKKSSHKGFRVGPKRTTHYIIDSESSRNEVTFTSKAPRETITGKSTTIKGHLDLKPRKLAKAKGRFSVEWKSIDTGNPTRNHHMLSAPWADANTYPDIVFTLKGIEKVKRKGKSGKSIKARLIGTMAMNGAEKKMKIPATLVYVQADENNKKGDEIKEGIGIRCKFTVALKDFNIKGKRLGQAFAAKQQVKVSLFLKRAEKSAGDKPKTPPSSQS